MSLVKDDKRKLKKITDKINDVVAVKDLKDEKLKKWYEFFNRIRKILRSNPLYSAKSAEEDQVALFEKLTNVLKDFIDIDVKIPGTNGKNVNDFLNELERRLENIKSKISKKLSLTKAVSDCEAIIKSLGDVATARASIPRVEGAEEDNLDTLIKERDNLLKKIDNIIKKMTLLENKYYSFSESEKNKLRIIGATVERDYNNTQTEKTNLETQIKTIEDQITAKKDLIKSIGTISKPHTKFKEKELKLINKNTQMVLRKLNDWIEILDGFDLKNMKVEKNINAESKALYTALGDYFANILKAIYFENRGWNLKTVDITKRRYVVKDRKKPIDFIDLGTGHNELNSLLARLKQNYDGKMKIVLFDEIGVMGETNVIRLLDEIRRQVESGEVLFAILTRVDSKINNVIFNPVKCD